MKRSTPWLDVKRRFGILGAGVRIPVLATVLVLTVVLVGFLAVGGLNDLIKVNRTQDRAQRTVTGAMAVQALVLEMMTGIQGFLLTGEESFLKRYREASQSIEKGLEVLTQALTAEETRADFAQARKDFKEWRTGFAEPAIKAHEEGQDLKNVASSLVKGQQVLERFKGMMQDFRKRHEGLISQSDHTVVARAEGVRRILIVGGSLIVVVTIVMLYSVYGTVRRPVAEVRLAVQSQTGTASDDVEGSVKARADEILKGLNTLAELSSEIVNTGAQLALGASKASAAVTQTTATAEELRQAAILAGEKAKHVAESSQQTVEISASGTQATQDTIEKMKVIKEQMQSIAGTVVKLGEQSQSIEAIINVVKDLADQSNLLAVNASIEAARAGEQGKGFSVVAQEIKTLADQSKEATQRIGAILEDTRQWVSAVVMATEAGDKAVDAGLEQSEMTGEAIRSLSASVAISSQAASVIDAQSDQQVTGVEQVAVAMASMEKVMHQNLDAALQLEGASGKLQELCESLTGLMEEFKAK